MLNDREQAFLKAAREVKSSRLKRWQRHPFRYSAVMVFNKAVFPIWKRGLRVKTRLFNKDAFTTLLPSGTDILLHGMKSHDSEVRLTAFLMRSLSAGDVFVDVGAHYGYYSVLAARWVGTSGKVAAFEATPDSIKLLKANTDQYPQVTVSGTAVSDRVGTVTFWTFAGPADEWNSAISKEDHPGYEAIPLEIPCVTLDLALAEMKLQHVDMVKIDVEGGEPAVVRGMQAILARDHPTIVIEYLFSGMPDNPHDEAVAMLSRMGYGIYAIRADGTLAAVSDAREYMRRAGMQSDNLVFQWPAGTSG